MAAENPAANGGTCFVVMGFGKKTDFETGRTLDLDKTYKYIIKPAVTDAGLTCIRADEIPHSGVIDVPMYEQLLKADVVIADLSTSNKNAFYELGVRHALKPYTTIVICEDGIKSFPFDVNHVVIQQYHHMGEGIDFGEVERFREVIKNAVTQIHTQGQRRNDSPVYTFLQKLKPPALEEAIQEIAEGVAKSAPGAPAPAASAGQAGGIIYSELMEQVAEAQAEGDFVEAKKVLSRLRRKMKEAAENAAKEASVEGNVPERPEDPYIIQQLALATYKSKQPTPQAALEEARDLLLTLNPSTSNDTETLGLWGAVHKRLWEVAGQREYLDEAVRGHERGFYLRNDYYNGINLAYLLNVRADNAAKLAKAADPTGAAVQWASAIADFVQAERIRREVLEICERWLADNQPPDEKASDEAKAAHTETRYWVAATKAEALLGTGKVDEAETAYNEAYALDPPKAFMVPSTKEQREKLQAMLTDSPLRHVKPDAA
jgi:tetratricopeptide (TPR) repeat protein